MSVGDRLSQVLNTAPRISVDDNSRLILFSDCHRGDNSWADDFGHNQHLYFHALTRYYEQGYTYVELGDADELMENRRFEDIRRAHSDVFWLLRKFYLRRRLYMIHGNHDMERHDPHTVARTLYRYRDDLSGEIRPLFEGIEVHEALVLSHQVSGQEILLVHGHQGDPINDRYWWIGRFLVRYLWRSLQLLGAHDPTSPAKNTRKRGRIERAIEDWIAQQRCPVIAGHTHRPRFPEAHELPYFNGGSCVHPRCITGIEIDAGNICLIKWWTTTTDAGAMTVTRSILAGPRPLSAFANWTGPRMETV